MSVDPDLAETDQPYAYAGDDPVNQSDPDGESAYSSDQMWLSLIERSPVDYVPVNKSLASEYLTVNGDGSPAQVKNYVDSFNWNKPVVMVAGPAEGEYIKYASSGTYGGNRLFGTNQIYTSPTKAVDDLFLRPYNNTAKYAWLVDIIQPIPILWGYVEDSASGQGTQFVVGPWEDWTEFKAVTPTRYAGKYTKPPYNVNPIATFPGQPLGPQPQLSSEESSLCGSLA